MVNIKRGSFKVDWHNRQMLEELIKKSVSMSEVLRQLGLTPASNAVTFRKYVAKYGIDISHFDPHLNRPQTRNGSTGRPLSEILIESTNYDRSSLKKRLIKEGVLQYKCVNCDMGPIWQGTPITLQLEHKNGVRTDHRLENLCFLCPNCHSQTTTFAGRNKTQLNSPVAKKPPYIPQPIKANFTKEELQELLWKIPLTKIGKKYNMSDNGVNRWVKKWELTKPPTGYFLRKSVSKLKVIAV
jgi:Zn finger protein HypA/HybF involved in hydrogenase expression